MRTRARSVLLVAALLLALTGCVKLDADLKVNEDETVSGSMVIAVDKDVAERAGTTPDKISEQIQRSIMKESLAGVTCKAYDEGTYAGSDCTLDKVPFSDMGGDGEGMTFQKQGERFVVSGGTGSTQVQLPDSADLPKPDLEVRITMPGKILEHDDGATIDGRTATYIDPARMQQIRLVSESGGGLPTWAVIGIAVLLLVAIAALLFWLTRRRKSGGQQYPDQPYPGQQYAGQQYAGQQYAGQQYPSQQHDGQGQQYDGQGQQYDGQGQQYPGQQYPGLGQPADGQQYPGQAQWNGPQQYPGRQPDGQPWGQQPPPRGPERQ